MKEVKGIRHGGGGAYLRCPVFTTVQFSLRDEGSSEYICVCEGRESLSPNFQTFQDHRHQFHGIGSWALTSAFRHPVFQSGTGAFRQRTGTPYSGNGLVVHVQTAGQGKKFTLHVHRRLLIVLIQAELIPWKYKHENIFGSDFESFLFLHSICLNIKIIKI